ncbi:unnamed protein product [Paramecium sonneborni]|uniref:Uncharacterized protein n=1 Tax=Paramecium sonneborni TaxID=65129 RepID=A0A8S1K9C3_9CILI|nr:unnamed protein product [Paramecium sonneborni]
MVYYSIQINKNRQNSKALLLIRLNLQFLKVQNIKINYQNFAQDLKIQRYTLKFQKTILRLFNINLQEEYKRIDHKILVRLIILKSESHRRIIQLINNRYIRLYEIQFYEQKKKNFIKKSQETKLEKDYKATKRKPAKKKDLQQQNYSKQKQISQAQVQIQQQQLIIDDIQQYIDQETKIQRFNYFDNI